LKGGTIYLAQLNNLIVTGSSRFLNKVYFSNGGTFNGNLNVTNNGDINITNGNLQLYGKIALQGYDNWLRINGPQHFTFGIYCGNGTLRTDGEFQVGDGGNCFKANSSAITCNRSLIVNAGVDFGYGATIRNAGLELYFTTPFIDFHFDNSNNDYTSRIIEGGKGVLNINGVTCSSSNLAANNVSATNVNVSSRINADAATAIFNNVYVKDELRSTTWAIDNITNLGSTFYVSPCIIFTNPSVYINSKSGTTVTLTITDNNIISSTIGGQTWTSGSKIKLMGRINTSVLGVVNGTMARQLNTTTAKTAYITLNFATTDDCAGIEQGKTYSGSAVGDLKMMMYEVNLNVNGTTKNRPVGIRMSSYNEDKKSSIDIYNGTVDDGKPIVRMGYLDGLPSVNGENPTGYGFYAVGNAFFSGRIVSGSGKIGNWNIGTDSLYIPNGTGISSNTNKWAFWAGESNNKNGASDTNAVFKVGHNGALVATNVAINGHVIATSGKIGNCSIENGRLVLGDTMNYANLNANTYSNYGFKLVADGNNNPWFQHSPQRDIPISPVDYNSYKCNGGEWFRIEFEFASTVQATTTDNYGANTYVNINIGLYGIKTNGASCWFIPFGGRSNSSGTVQKVSTAVQLDSDVRSFSVCLQCAGSGTFSGTLKIRNISVCKMMGNNLIVDGAITAAKIRSGEVTANAIASNAITSDKISANAITAAKIKSGEVTSDKIAANAITADKITTNNIAGTNGWINLRSGTFKYNDGALAWDGSTMTIGGFKISKYKIINDAIGICSTTGQEWAFWAGASSGANAPFHVGHNGSLYAENATIGGIIRAKQSISVYNATFATYQDVVKWDGSNLSIGLVGNAGSTGVKGAQIAFSGSQISVGNSSIVCGSISGTNSSFTNVWVENFTNASTFKENITCNRNLKVEGDLRFIDYEQSDSGNNANRRPVASVTADGSRVAYLSSAVKNSKHSIYVKGQYGKTGNNYSGYYFYNDATSDIRLKENIGVCNINALSAINKMNICSFDWKEEKNHQSLGLIADELEKIDPMLTLGGGYDSNGSMNVKCIDRLLLTEYAIKGIQELYEQYKLQKKEIQKLKKEIQKLK
jgi:hypothetical protein